MSSIKAVIFDIDGTAIANFPDALPTERVIKAVHAARDGGIHIACATGRNYTLAKHILKPLELHDPCIVAAGTQIVAPETGEELWAAYLSEPAVRYALQVLKPYNLQVVMDGETYETAKTADQIEPREYPMLDVQRVPVKELPDILARLAENSEITAIPVHSSLPDYNFLHVTARSGTKEFAVTELLNILHIDKADAAGVGDGLNDMELFKSVGHKVAMGNAKDELKEAADEVVASVDDDGLAQYLEGLLR